MVGWPTGTVTFLFTDIEGSTLLLRQLGDHYPDVIAQHHRLLRAAFSCGGGQEVRSQGDAFVVVFARAKDALSAAVSAQREIMAYTWPEGTLLRVRMGIHTGEPVIAATGYEGLDVHLAARIGDAGHGGQILLSEATYRVVKDDLPEGVCVRELGAYRLKDFSQPQRLFQVVTNDLRSDFPQVRSIEARLSNLPRQLTTFVGREREIAEVKRLLTSCPVVTLTGTGGAGKTRLGLQVAADLDVMKQYPDGVWLIELASLSDPALVPKAAATALGLREQPGQTLTDTILDYGRSKSMLYVLDNCEHLLPACAELMSVLLKGCPALRVMATSREPLGISGESVWRVPSLSLPGPGDAQSIDHLVQYEAIRLFVERASQHQPGFAITSNTAAAVVQICQRLDGIPLAIELAAARVRGLSVGQIASRLDNRFRLLTGGSRTALPRQRTLEATMGWSYDLLSEEERRVFRRLSVFQGGWELDAAETVCSGHGVERSRTLNVLGRLVDKSLVAVETHGDEARYRLLETLRQYGRDRLQESNESVITGRRHRDWYLTLAEQAHPELFGSQQQLWIKRLEADHDNLRASLEWSHSEMDGAEVELRLAGALFWFWFRHADWNEARERLERALSRSVEAPPAVLPKALVGATQFAWRRGDLALAKTLGEQGLALSQRLGNREGTAWFLCHLGIVEMYQGNYHRARSLFDESAGVSSESGNTWLGGMTLLQMGMLMRLQGDYESATVFQTQALSILRNVGDQWSIAYAFNLLGDVAFDQHDYHRATAYFTSSLKLSREVGDRWGSEECLEALALVASARGQYDRAARLLGVAEVLRQALGWRALEQTKHDQRVAGIRAALGDDSFAVAWDEGRAMGLDQAIDYALADIELRL